MTDNARLQQLQDEIALALLDTCRTLGLAAVEMNALTFDGSTSLQTRDPAITGPTGSILSPETVFGPLEELREVCYEPGKGTWFSIRVVVRSNGESEFHFNYNQRPYTYPREPDLLTPLPGDREPDPNDYTLLKDLEQFPRDSDSLPDWYPRSPTPAATQVPVEATGPLISTPAERAERASAASLFPPEFASLMGSSAWVFLARAVRVHAVSVLAANEPEWEDVPDEFEPNRWVSSRIFDLVYEEKLAAATASAIKSLWRVGQPLFQDRAVDSIPDDELVSDPSEQLEILLEDVCDVIGDPIAHRMSAAAGFGD